MSSLSERNGLQAPHPPALVTVEAPLTADIVGYPRGLINDGPPDGRFWDIAPIGQRAAISLALSALGPFEHRATTDAFVSC